MMKSQYLQQCMRKSQYMKQFLTNSTIHDRIHHKLKQQMIKSKEYMINSLTNSVSPTVIQLVQMCRLFSAVHFCFKMNMLAVIFSKAFSKLLISLYHACIAHSLSLSLSRTLCPSRACASHLHSLSLSHTCTLCPSRTRASHIHSLSLSHTHTLPISLHQTVHYTIFHQLF